MTLTSGAATCWTLFRTNICISFGSEKIRKCLNRFEQKLEYCVKCLSLMQQFQYFLPIVFFTMEELDGWDFSFQCSPILYTTFYLDLNLPSSFHLTFILSRLLRLFVVVATSTFSFICSDRSKFYWVNCVRLFCFHNVYIWIPLNFVDLFMTWSSNLMKAKSRSVILVGGWPSPTLIQLLSAIVVWR